MPSRTANGVAHGPYTPAIAPHLRVKLSNAEDPKAHTNGHTLATRIEGSQNGAAHHLGDQEQLYSQSMPQHISQSVQRQEEDARSDREAVDDPHFGNLQLAQKGDAARQQLELAKAEAADSNEPASSSTPEALDDRAALNLGEQDPGRMTSLQGRRVRGIVFDTETTGEVPCSCVLAWMRPEAICQLRARRICDVLVRVSCRLPWPEALHSGDSSRGSGEQREVGHSHQSPRESKARKVLLQSWDFLFPFIDWLQAAADSMAPASIKYKMYANVLCR